MRFFKSESLQVFSIRDFRLFILARFLLTLGVQMQFSTIYLQIYYEYSKEELTLGMIGLSEAIPFIITSLFSGHYADKLHKKKILNLATFLLILSGIILSLQAEQHVLLFQQLGQWALFGMVFLFGIIRSFLAATANPFISQLVPRNLYTHSATWNSTAWHTGAILGPVLSGFLYGYHDAYNGFACHLLETIILIGALLAFMNIKNQGAPQFNEPRESVFDSMRVGIKFVFNQKMVLSAISLDLFAVLFGGAVALIPAFTDKILHLGPSAYGLLRTAPAIGAVVMALVMVIYPPGKKAGLALLWSVVAFGVFTILFALSTNYWVAFFMLFATGAFDNVSVVVRHSILQLMTPDHMRGRVSAINSIFIGSSNEIGAFESGVTAQMMGLVRSIIFGGAMTIVTVGIVDRMNKSLRRLDITKY